MFIPTDEQNPFQKPTTLIVKEVFIPSIFHELRNHDDDGAIRMLFRKIENELNDGNDDEAVWGGQDTEPWRFPSGCEKRFFNVPRPVRLKQFGVLAGLDVQGDHFR